MLKRKTAKRLERKRLRAAGNTDGLHLVGTTEATFDLAAAAGNGTPTFTGLAYSGGIMHVKGFGAPVVVDLSGVSIDPGNRPMLLDHNDEHRVGHAERINIDSDGIRAEGIISGESESAREVVESSRRGFPWHLSISARVLSRDFVPAGRSVLVNNRSFDGPLVVARKASLYEISFVSVPGDVDSTVAIAARHSRKDLPMEFTQWLQAKGFVPDDLTESQTNALKATFDAEKAKDVEIATLKASHDPNPEPTPEPAPVADPPDPVVQLRAKMSAETKRINKITDLCEGHPDIQAKAVEAGWDVQTTEVAVLKARLDAGPAIHVRGDIHQPQDDVIQAAFCRTIGLPDLDKQFKPEVLEASDRLRGYGMQELLLSHASEAGYHGRNRITPGNINEVLHAAFSTHSVTTMLTQLGHKSLLSGFYSVPQTWREVAVSATVNDFKQMTAFRMTADLEYEELNEAGNIAHGTLGQETYTMQAKTYAKMMLMTRQDIINDDLGTFNDIRRRLGMGCALKVLKEFWTAWLSASNGAAFWTADRGNLVTTSSFGDTGIKNAIVAFRQLAGPDGNMMNLNPDRVLIPPELEATATEYYASREVRNTTASTKQPTSNIYGSRFRPIVVPEMSNSNYTGYSTTDWYMLPDPSILASASVCFLNGVETPVIETAEADFNTLGVQWRGYHDFGVQMTEWRATVCAEA